MADMTPDEQKIYAGEDVSNYQGIPTLKTITPMKTPATAAQALARYKFRAECIVDVLRFFELIVATDGTGVLVNVHVDPLDELNTLPDVVASFGTTLSENQLIDMLETLPDSHVIEDTITEESKYTGDRRSVVK